MPKSLFADLNPQQQKAAQIVDGPLLILAGAGSGKTKCLTHRIAHLLDCGVGAENILAVTFTNKAAGEMQSRIQTLLQNYSGIMPLVGTFHAICGRILRREIDFFPQAGISRNFTIFDSTDSQNVMKLCLKEKHFDPKEIKVKAVLSWISAAKNHLLSIEEYCRNRDHFENKFSRAVQILAPLYQKKLQENNAADFDDLLKLTVELFESVPEILEKYQQKWTHISVDEYQDTNFAQYRLIRLLAAPQNNLCVIGDDHQSIYRFRGADFTNILNFENDFPDAQVIKLEQNYRSSGNILLNANCLISKNQTGRPKNLWTENEPGQKIQVRQVRDERDEGDFVSRTIGEIQRSGEASFGDFAVLYRMNAQSRAIEESLLRHQIPYQIVGGVRFFERREIKDLVAYLRLLQNPRDDLSFLRIINVPTRKIGPASLEILKNFGQNYSLSLLQVLKSADEISELPAKKRDILKDFYEKISELQKISEKTPVSVLLEKLIESIKFLEFLDDGSVEGTSRIENVRELFSVAAKYDSAESPLMAFLEGVALISELDNLGENRDFVTLMTIHASKGLEFPNVFLPGWEEGIFPGSSAAFSAEDLEEERRLGYVAITRAEKNCTILHAQQRMIFGRREFGTASKFLAELDEDAVDQVSLAETSEDGFFRGRRDFGSTAKTYFSESKVSDFPAPSLPKNESDFSVGDRIAHAEFGAGTILRVDGDVLSVAFSNGSSLKKIVGSVAPIEKITEDRGQRTEERSERRQKTEKNKQKET